MPQWASWALKSLSGKFYKYTPSVQNQSGSEHKEVNPVCEPTPTTKTSELKSNDTPSTKAVSNVWGELENGSFSETEDWKDASDVLTASTAGINAGWDNNEGKVSIALVILN